MTSLSLLWQAIESIPGPATVLAEWRDRCGELFPIVQPFLKPTEMTAANYPCADCSEPQCYRRIMHYGDGEIAAVCQNKWNHQPDVPLSRADTVIHDIDMVAFTRAVTRPLGIRSQQPTARAHGAWGIGLLREVCGVERPVVLMIHFEHERFSGAIKKLLAESPEKFVLLAPTMRHKDLEVHDLLERRGIAFAALEDCLSIDAAGSFVAARTGLFPFHGPGDLRPPTQVGERATKVQKFLQTHGLTIKDILNALNLDRRDFNRWRKGDLPDSSTKSKKIEGYLHQGPRTV